MNSQRRSPRTLGAAAAALTLCLAPATALADRWVDTAGSDLANDCTVQASPCATIQNAVDQATSGESVFVAAGTYAESPSVVTPVRMLGAKAGQDARSRDTSTGETIVTGTVLVRASGVIVDGFTVANPAGPAIHADNADVVGATVENVFVDGGTQGLFLERALSASVRRNLIQNVTGAGIEIGSDLGTPDPIDDVQSVSTVENNEVVNTTIGITGYYDLSFVRFNVVRDSAGAGAALTGQLIDTVVEGNTLSNYSAGAGVRLAADPERDLTEDTVFKCNTISGNLFGVQIGSSQTALDGVVFSSNNIEGNSIGLANSAAPAADAIFNWWGCAAGPGDPACDDAIGPATVAPFLTAVSTCSSCFQDVDCDDGLVCNGAETCDVGTNVCQAGTPPVCDTQGLDAQCNVGSCEEPTGCIVTQLPDATVCDDGAACSTPDLCEAGVCVAAGNGDLDADAICQDEDNCPGIANPGQEDADQDGLGAICDPDELGMTIDRIALKSAIKGPGSGQYVVKGFLVIDAGAGDVIDAEGDITVTLKDGAGYQFTRVFKPDDCVEKKGKIKCRSADKKRKIKIAPFKKGGPGAMKVKIGFKKLDEEALFLPPGNVTITHENGLVRFGENTNCSTSGGPILVCD